MSLSAVFLTGIGLTFLVAFTVVVYLRRAFSGILLDLCGTEERAHFWRVFSSVILVIVPIWCALDYRLPAEPVEPALFQVTAMLEEALSGLLAVLAGIGIILTVFISRRAPSPAVRVPAAGHIPTA